MHIDLLETQALPRPTQAGTREVSDRHKAQGARSIGPLHTRPAPRASKGARLYKVRFEIQAQDTPQMPQAPDAYKGYPYISPYQRLTIPARQKGGRPQDAVPTYQATGQAQGTAPTYQADQQGGAPTEIMVPMWERAARGEGVNGAGLLNEPTIRLRTLASREKKQGDLLDIPRFIGYTVGAVAVLGLYLIIPLMILLNAILPSAWNRLFIALGILLVGEMLICTVLAKTIPKGTRHVVQENRGDVLVQR